MKLDKLKDLYQRNNIPDIDYFKAATFLRSLNEIILVELDDIDIIILDKLIGYLIENKLNTIDSFIILMRYFNVIDRKDIYIHLTKYTGMIDVIDNIIDRLKKIHGLEKAKLVLGEYKPPYLGVSPQKLPKYASNLMNLLEANLSVEEVKQVVTGNNHNLSEKSVLSEKIEYEKAKSFEEYLKTRHQRKVAVLQEHLDNNQIWFEQIITKEVVDFVKSNQEVLSAKIVDDKLYITKIPYDTLNYLNAKEEKMRKYYACHCPFAREAILNDFPKISKNFCYCSGGFAKFPFEVILNQKLDIVSFESVLSGSDICRFVIDLKGVKYKK